MYFSPVRTRRGWYLSVSAVFPCNVEFGLGSRAGQGREDPVEANSIQAFSLAVSIMAGTIVGIEKWKEEKWTVLADWTIVRRAPQVQVSDEKTVESPSGNV